MFTNQKATIDRDDFAYHHVDFERTYFWQVGRTMCCSCVEGQDDEQRRHSWGKPEIVWTMSGLIKQLYDLEIS